MVLDPIILLCVAFLKNGQSHFLEISEERVGESLCLRRTLQKEIVVVDRQLERHGVQAGPGAQQTQTELLHWDLRDGEAQLLLELVVGSPPAAAAAVVWCGVMWCSVDGTQAKNIRGKVHYMTVRYCNSD